MDPTPPRSVIAVTGPDRTAFLQDLVTNDLARLAEGPVYAALLSPQGKYLADFLLVAEGEAILIDVAGPLADGLGRRLGMYRLRRKVELAPAGTGVAIGADGHPDPRHPDLPRRRYGGAASGGIDAAQRVALGVPEAVIDLVPDDSYVLEMGFERLNGVDFRKGCYVGQEIVARMKHKTELRKGLARIALDGPAAAGEAITTADGRPVGRLGTVAGDRALAHLRYDRAEDLRIGETRARLEARAI